MNKIFFKLILSLLLIFPALSMACENSTAMLPGEFSEGVVSKIKMSNDDGPDGERVYTIYLSSHRTVPAGQAVTTCKRFFVLSAYSTTFILGKDFQTHFVDGNIGQEIIRTLKTAFALNLHIQCSLTGGDWEAKGYTPTISRNDFLSYSKRP